MRDLSDSNPRKRPKAAHGPHSNVVVNLKAKEAVALAFATRLLVSDDADLASALAKVRHAGGLAQIPWVRR